MGTPQAISGNSDGLPGFTKEGRDGGVEAFWTPMTNSQHSEYLVLHAQKYGGKELGIADARQLYERIATLEPLEKIFVEADLDGNGTLSESEFLLFVHLLRMLRKGGTLPTKLSGKQIAYLYGADPEKATLERVEPKDDADRSLLNWSARYFKEDKDFMEGCLRIIKAGNDNSGPGCIPTWLCIAIESAYIPNHKKALSAPIISVSLVAASGKLLEETQDSPACVYVRPNFKRRTFFRLVTPIGKLMEGSAVYIELKHWKAKKNKWSTLAWKYIPIKRIIKRSDGMLQLVMSYSSMTSEEQNFFAKPLDFRSHIPGNTAHLPRTLSGGVLKMRILNSDALVSVLGGDDFVNTLCLEDTSSNRPSGHEEEGIPENLDPNRLPGAAPSSYAATFQRGVGSLIGYLFGRSGTSDSSEPSSTPAAPPKDDSVQGEVGPPDTPPAHSGSRAQINPASPRMATSLADHPYLRLAGPGTPSPGPPERLPPSALSPSGAHPGAGVRDPAEQAESAAATQGEGGGNERANAGELARLDSRLLGEEEEREYQATLESSRLAREAEELRIQEDEREYQAILERLAEEAEQSRLEEERLLEQQLQQIVREEERQREDQIKEEERRRQEQLRAEEERRLEQLRQDAGLPVAADEADDDSHICPITFEVMTDPVILTGDSQTYERQAITEWLATNNTSPLTGVVLTDPGKVLIINYYARRTIAAWQARKQRRQEGR